MTLGPTDEPRLEFIWFNDFDLGNLDLWVEMPTGWADGPIVARQGHQVGGGAGEVVVEGDQQVASMDKIIPCQLICETAQLAEQRIDQIKELFYNGAEGKLRFGGWPDREAMVTIRQVAVLPSALPGQEQGASISIYCRAHNPYMYSRRADVWTLRPGMELAIPVGTAASEFDLRVEGPTSGDTINVNHYDAGGTLRSLLKLVGAALLPDENLSVLAMSANGEITKRTAAGSIFNAFNYLHKDGHFITLAPRWALSSEGVHQVLTIDQGTAVVTHRRAYR
jgi:hypothetical protein